MFRVIARPSRILRPFLRAGSTKTSADFFVNGKPHKVGNLEPSLTVLDYLRTKQLTGCKLACGEGGCGACTVSVASWENDKVVHKSINACLMPLYTADGTHITTVEGVGTSKTGLHPIQSAMANNFASQCGYCTPGFVTTLFTTFQNDPKASQDKLYHSISSNLCRCTGYRSIAATVTDLANQAAKGTDMGSPIPFPAALQTSEKQSLCVQGQYSEWVAPTSVTELFDFKDKFPQSKIVSGNTEIGVEQRFKQKFFPVLISPANIKEFQQIRITDKELEIGSSVSLTQILETLVAEQANRKKEDQVIQAIIDQLKWFSGPSIRNVATLGGQILTASPISDLNPVFVALGALFNFQSKTGKRSLNARDFFVGYRKTRAAEDEVLTSITLPLQIEGQYVKAYKQCKRREDDIAIINGCLNVHLKDKKVTDVCLSFGGMGPTTITAPKTQQFLKGKEWDNETLQAAIQSLHEELRLPKNVPGGMPEYRETGSISFFLKFFYTTRNQAVGDVPKNILSIGDPLEFTYPTGKQVLLNPNGPKPVGESILHAGSLRQVTGEAIYTDDLPKRPNELVAQMVVSSEPHANIKSIDASQALAVPGVIAFYTAKDIPGKNAVGDIIHDEEIFAIDTVTTVGQPIGAIVAEDPYIATFAASLVKVEYEPLPAVLSIEDAIAENSIWPLWNDKIERGDIESGFAKSDHTVEGEIKIGGQEHFYFETNVTLAEPTDLEMKIFTSSQNLKHTQISVARVLGIDMNKVSCSAKRIGGGFGGKETFNVPGSCVAAVAAHHLQRPVRLLLGRDEDMKWTGHRHPFLAKYKVGFSKDGLVQALDVQLYSNGGNKYDLSGPVINRAMLHSDASYWIPNIRVTGKIAKTNTISNTAFRGFGGPQGQIVAETWMDHIASHLKADPAEIRKKNLYKHGEQTHFNQEVNVNFHEMWNKCLENIQWEKKIQERDEFNRNNRYKKKGLAILPVKFGIAFTVPFLNQGTALINIYKGDGSVLIATGGVEMGQGLHTKCLQVASASLGIPLDKIYISETNTDKVPNSSATAGSVGSDLYAMAVLKGCEELNARLQPFKDKDPRGRWLDWVQAAWKATVPLNVIGYHTIPVSGWNFQTSQGKPFHYFTTGVGATEVIVDTLTGDHRLLHTDIVMDVGKSINPIIDVGQIEGAFIQGYGWLTMEELIWGDKDHTWIKPGHLFTMGPGNYKIPSIDDIPGEFNVTLMEASDNSQAVHSSRGVGEPPLLLSTAAVFAIRDAISAARKDRGVDDHFKVNLPLTCERIRMACLDDITKTTVGENDIDFQARGSW